MPKARELLDHKTGREGEVHVNVVDEPGQGNANHEYNIYFPHDNHNQELNASMCQRISFQNGPIKENDVNGVTNESLMAIVIDRLRGFQSGEFACRENAVALTKLEESLMWLKKRTQDRIVRGVEGTNNK